MRISNTPTKTLLSVVSISAAIVGFQHAHSNELTRPETRHAVTCPDPSAAPCIMNRPFNAMDYTLLTKDVTISEGNGVWIVNLAKGKAESSGKQTIRVMDFFGELHVIEVSVAEAPKSGGSLKRASPAPKGRTSAKDAAPDGASDKPISLEKFIPK